MGRTAGVHPQGPGRRLVARRCISTEGARQTGRQAAGAIDVEAGQTRQVQDALAVAVLASRGTIPVVAAMVAMVAASSGIRGRARAEGQVHLSRDFLGLRDVPQP